MTIVVIDFHGILDHRLDFDPFWYPLERAGRLLTYACSPDDFRRESLEQVAERVAQDLEDRGRCEWLAVLMVTSPCDIQEALDLLRSSFLAPLERVRVQPRKLFLLEHDPSRYTAPCDLPIRSSGACPDAFVVRGLPAGSTVLQRIHIAYMVSAVSPLEAFITKNPDRLGLWRFSGIELDTAALSRTLAAYIQALEVARSELGACLEGPLSAEVTFLRDDACSFPCAASKSEVEIPDRITSRDQWVTWCGGARGALDDLVRLCGKNLDTCREALAHADPHARPETVADMEARVRELESALEDERQKLFKTPFPEIRHEWPHSIREENTALLDFFSWWPKTLRHIWCVGTILCLLLLVPFTLAYKPGAPWLKCLEAPYLGGVLLSVAGIALVVAGVSTYFRRKTRKLFQAALKEFDTAQTRVLSLHKTGIGHLEAACRLGVAAQNHHAALDALECARHGRVLLNHGMSEVVRHMEWARTIQEELHEENQDGIHTDEKAHRPASTSFCHDLKGFERPPFCNPLFAPASHHVADEAAAAPVIEMDQAQVTLVPSEFPGLKSFMLERDI